MKLKIIKLSETGPREAQRDPAMRW